MTVTVFKNVKVHSYEYNQVMKVVGDTLAAGGKVDLNHRIEYWGHGQYEERCDITVVNDGLGFDFPPAEPQPQAQLPFNLA